MNSFVWSFFVRFVDGFPHKNRSKMDQQVDQQIIPTAQQQQIAKTKKHVKLVAVFAISAMPCWDKKSSKGQFKILSKITSQIYISIWPHFHPIPTPKIHPKPSQNPPKIHPKPYTSHHLTSHHISSHYITTCHVISPHMFFDPWGARWWPPTFSNYEESKMTPRLSNVAQDPSNWSQGWAQDPPAWRQDGHK